MAVAEATRVEKTDKVEKREREKDKETPGSGTPSGGPPSWATWVPRKWQELKTFFVEVRSELKKVTWPSKTEVQATTEPRPLHSQDVEAHSHAPSCPPGRTSVRGATP